MGKGKRLHPATTNVSGAADSGESRDGGTRAVSFSDPLRKTESGLDRDHLHRALCSGLAYRPDPDIMAMAKEISHVCSVGMNAEFLARGFVAAVEYYRTLEPENEQKRESVSGTVDDEQGVTSTGKEVLPAATQEQLGGGPERRVHGTRANGRRGELPLKDSTEGVHLQHCNFGEYPNACKYGDDDCPALTESWSWFGKALERAARSSSVPVGEQKQEEGV